MDINNTNFHLLTGENDWEPILEQRKVHELWWDRERTSLSLLPRVLQFPQRPTEQILTPQDRRGSARDTFGNIYWIGEDQRTIRILPGGTEQAGEFWNVAALFTDCQSDEVKGDFYPAQKAISEQNPWLRGLTVTRHHYLVIGTLEPAGLLIFDLHAGGAPVWSRWPDTIPFAPFDLAAAADCGVWVLDRDLGSDQGRYWKLDRYFRVHAISGNYETIPPEVHDYFQPVAGDVKEHALHYFPQATEIDAASPVLLNKPVAIEGLPDGSVLIMGSGADDSYSVIQRYLDGVETNSVELEGELFEHLLDDPRLKGHDFAFVPHSAELPGTVAGELSLVLDNGNQAFEFNLYADHTAFSLSVRPRYLPLRQYSGKALVPGEQLVYYDMQERWYPITAQPRNRYTSEAELDSLVFDGKQPGCVWHRINIDGCIPEGAVIEFDSRAADDKVQLAHTDWRSETVPHKRQDGSEILLHRPFTPEEEKIEGTGTWEWLIQDARGRYLELRMRFRSNGRQTPRLRALRVYYPRFSYVRRFLPAIYREQDQEMHFLERYLANVEGFFTTIEERIAGMHSLFDVRTVPEGFLDWLAGWLGAILHSDWDVNRRRLFIDHAELLFRWHGTQIGMRAAIHLAIDPCPDERIFQELKDQRSHSTVGGAGGRTVRIVERFLYRNLPGVFIGDPTAKSGLSVSSVSKTFEELGDAEYINRQYRNFLYHQYKNAAQEGEEIIDALNSSWDSAFESFDAIEFDPDRPEHAAELLDWFRFIQRELALSRTWEPAHGVYALHVRYQESMRKRYSTVFGEDAALNELNQRWNTAYTTFEAISFSPVQPQNPLTAEDWQYFTEQEIGFTYARVTQQDTALYQEFLARRYKQIERLNQTYGLTGDKAWPAFNAIALPAESKMPSAERELHDWIQFVSLMLPIRRNAHRFTVLVPTEPGELPQSRLQRLAQVEAIVAKEKPAHTDFDVKLYWALFQVGSARLGQDTVLGEGARYTAIALGNTYLGQGVVGSSHPWHVQDRTLIHRDHLPRSTQGEINNE
ncbi:MAG: phage tail protein [Gammaproteobacteria bacterium]|nr:phage tail protein [Gammaproteobacteria bacterium]MDH5653081.1 phage tail protein [Gammaproteobacteria bacterium]